MRICSFLAAMMYVVMAQASNGDSIFEIKKIHELRISFPYPAFYDSLVKSNSTDRYLQVNIQFNDKFIDSVGIKAKGNSSFNNPGQKKPFKIDFNEFVSGKKIHGLKKLNFNNSFKDPTFMREKITNDFIRKFGSPAPRVAYCNVYFNNQLWGLYTIVESIDDEFCDRWFNNNDGNLFQGDPRGTFQWKGPTQNLYTTDYDLENNSTTNNWSDLIGLINTLNNSPAKDLKKNLDTIFNLGNFVKQWAVQNIFASFDSYLGSGHNYYLYHDTISRKFEFIAWDNNEAFGSFKMGLTDAQIINTDIFYINLPASRPMCEKLLKDSLCKKMYIDSLCKISASFTNSSLDSTIDSLYQFIKAAVYADPKKYYTNADFDKNIVSDVMLTGPGGINVLGLKNFIRDRSTAIQNSFGANQVTCKKTSAAFDTKNHNDYSIQADKIIFEEPVDLYVMDAMGKTLKNTLHVTELEINSLPHGINMIVYQHAKTKGVLRYFVR